MPMPLCGLRFRSVRASMAALQGRASGQHDAVMLAAETCASLAAKLKLPSCAVAGLAGMARARTPSVGSKHGTACGEAELSGLGLARVAEDALRALSAHPPRAC